MSARSIAFNILANDNATGVFNRVARGATGVGDAVDSTNRRSSFSRIGLSAVAVGAAVVKFGSDSVTAFKSAATETTKLQKVFGGTAEDASRLRFAAKDTGTDIDALAKGLAKASQAASAGKAFTALGIQTRDASGKLKSMSELLPQLLDKFSKMQAGPARTAAIMSIFGKSGLALTPILTKNSAELAELGKKSDEYGATLSGKSLKAMKANAQSQRDMSLAMNSVKVQLGAALMPMLATLSHVLASNVVPAVTSVTKVFTQHKTLLLLVVGAITSLILITKAVSFATNSYQAIMKIASLFTREQAAAQVELNVAMEANPIGIVVAAVVALVAIVVVAYKNSKTFRDVVEDAWKGIQAVVKAVWNGFLKPVFSAFVQAFKDVGSWATSAWHVISAAWTAIGKIFSWLWNTVAKPIFNLWKAELGLVLTAGSLLWKGISTAWNAIGRVFSWLWNSVAKPVFGLMRSEFNIVLSVGNTLWKGIAAGGAWVGRVFGAIGDGARAVGRIMSDAFNGIAGIVKGAVNGVIDGVNFFIRMLDKIHISAHLPGWLGGAGFDLGFNIGQIPRLAAGGIVRATPGGILANLGEGGRDEAVIPLPASGLGNVVHLHIHLEGGAVGDPRDVGRKLAGPVREALLALKHSGGVSTLGLS